MFVKINNYIPLTGNTIKEFKQPTIPPLDNELKVPEVVLRRTQSFESDEKLVFPYILLITIFNIFFSVNFY